MPGIRYGLPPAHDAWQASMYIMDNCERMGRARWGRLCRECQTLGRCQPRWGRWPGSVCDTRWETGGAPPAKSTPVFSSGSPLYWNIHVKGELKPNAMSLTTYRPNCLCLKFPQDASHVTASTELELQGSPHEGVCSCSYAFHLVIEAAGNLGPEPGPVTEVGCGGHLGSCPAARHSAFLWLQELHITRHMCHLRQTSRDGLGMQEVLRVTSMPGST